MHPSIIDRVSPAQVQDILQDFERQARLVHARADGSEAWRFDVGAYEYELHYYPEDDTLLKRYVGGGNAAREFAQLQTLQKLVIPATRVIANLKGFRIGGRKGDACIIVRDPTAVRLNDLLRLSATMGRRERLAVTASLIQLLESLHREKLCPQPLLPEAFARRGDGVVVLADGAATLGGIVDERRLLELDAATRHVTSATERLRFWKHFSDEPPTRHNVVAANESKRWARQLNRDGDGPFAPIVLDEWSGTFVRRVPLVLPWSQASRLEFDRATWQAALPAILDVSRWHPMKDDHAARVLSGAIDVAGRRLEIVIKRPAFRSGIRGAIQQLRTSRARRMWDKTWRMLAMGFACEHPLILLERRRGIRVVEQLIVFERVPGPTMQQVELDALATVERERLLYRCGRTLRQIDVAGFTHCDAKHTNWIAWTDAGGAVRPVLIDLDGVRFYRWRGMGIERFLRAMRSHPQATADDIAAIERGYCGTHC